MCVIWEFSISVQNMASYELKPQHEEQIPCHSSFSEGIICGLHRGSNAVRGYFRSNLGIICGRGSFAALYSSQNNSLLERVDSRVQYIWRLRVMVSWYSTTYKIFWLNNDSNSKKIYSFGTWHWFLEEEESNFLSEFIYLSRMAVCNQVIVIVML